MTQRTDLPYLRARSLRSTAPAGLDTASAGAPAYSTSAGGGTSLDLDQPAGLDTASAGAPAYSTSAGGGTSLDLGLDTGSAGAPATSTGGSRHVRPLRHDLGLPGIRADERRLMTEQEPVLELTRMQSAAGALEARAAVPNPSEVVLGLVFETGDDRQSLVLPGLSQQGPDPRRPIFRATSSGVAVNLRRVTEVHRLLLFAVPTRPSKQMPGGTVTVTTYGGSRLEAPLVAGPTLGAQALMTGYVVEGRLVIRAEHDPYSGTLQQVCAAYGYRELSWRDPYTPLV
ncbi:hypothetical protein [Flexivirga sp.]|uniref:hypothetical protein n=1 Tax=Flexivirga sp. TaxID=1962927 RepID=UPI003F7D6CE7